MKIYIGADHNGYNLRRSLIGYLKDAGYEVVDDGDRQLDPEDDFPLFTQKVINGLLGAGEPEDRGILICGSGQGVCMAANRHKGIRAALGHSVEAARSSRNDDDSNVLCLASDDLNDKQAESITNVWLNTPFAGASRFKRRIREMDEY